ncbi:MAG: dCTP deaminase [Candidatus Njordarchaeales archaeon]
MERRSINLSDRVVDVFGILTKKDLLEKLERGELVIDPFFEENLGEITYDITLSSEFVFIEPYHTPILDPENLNVRANRIHATSIYLQPHVFVLGRSIEWIELPNNIIAMISGKSSLARLGIEVEAAYLLHPGHKGYVILEISNRNTIPVKLKKGLLVAQLLFFKVSPVKSYSETGSFGIQQRIELPRMLKFVKREEYLAGEEKEKTNTRFS